MPESERSNIYHDIPKNIRELIYKASHTSTDCYLSGLFEEIVESGISSPPEQLFYGIWNQANENSLYPYISLLPQRAIGKYFADFEVATITYFVNQVGIDYTGLWKEIEERLGPPIIVEIDGHWHEKTPEQVEYDKKRERFFVGKGYKVFRFSAREVLRDTEACVEEVQRVAYEQIWKVRKQLKVTVSLDG